jgi:AraC-like DNA-binding protein
VTLNVPLPLAPVEEGNPSATLWSSELVEMGRFWCSTRHPEFRTAGPIRGHTFVFPETAVWIEHEGRPPFFGNPAGVALYNDGQPYTRAAVDPQGDRCTWFALSDELARDVVASRDPRVADSDRVFAVPFGPVAPGAALKARCLVRHAVQRGPDALLMEESIVDLFADVVAGVYDHYGRQGPAVTRRQQDVVDSVACQLYRTCTENHSLATLAGSVDVSVFHLCRLFRRATGLTMHAYRHQLRLTRALDALGSPDVDLLALAVELGYSSHSHFTSMFRRQLGLVPSQARARLAMRMRVG